VIGNKIAEYYYGLDASATVIAKRIAKGNSV